jgi:hypothetical protein
MLAGYRQQLPDRFQFPQSAEKLSLLHRRAELGNRTDRQLKVGVGVDGQDDAHAFAERDGSLALVDG